MDNKAEENQSEKLKRTYRSNQEKFQIVLRYIQTNNRSLVAKEFGITPNQVTDYYSTLVEKAPSLFERKKYLRPVISNYELAKEVRNLSLKNEVLKSKNRFYQEAIDRGELVLKEGNMRV